ncbi:Replication protein, partial [Pseudomonas amygdali pv. morsprunorum]
MVSWLVFDLDHANALAWDDAGLPAPNLMVRNRKSGHSQLFYAVPSVCTTENARTKPIQYMKAIYAAFAARLDADVDYHGGPVAKTPGHPWWETTEFHSHVYELGELASAVELTVKPWATGPKLDQVSHSRHCILFEQLRYFAYSIVNRERELGSFESFMRSLDAYAYNHNSFLKQGFSENLPLSSIRATVKSVGRWTWDRYTGDRRCHRGAMQLDGSLSLTERQSLAARRTHELRHKATESKIRAACRQLQDQGKALVRSAIAALAGVSASTVARYAHILSEVTKPATVSVLKVSADAMPTVTPGDQAAPRKAVQCLKKQALTDRAQGVSYAVHQIPAVPQGPQAGESLTTEHEDG